MHIFAKVVFVSVGVISVGVAVVLTCIHYNKMLSLRLRACGGMPCNVSYVLEERAESLAPISYHQISTPTPGTPSSAYSPLTPATICPLLFDSQEP